MHIAHGAQEQSTIGCGLCEKAARTTLHGCAHMLDIPVRREHHSAHWGARAPNTSQDLKTADVRQLHTEKRHVHGSGRQRLNGTKPARNISDDPHISLGVQE